MTQHLVGYCRVSTLDQNLGSQEQALLAAGCQRLFQEKVSGASPGRERPALQHALTYCREGDTLCVFSLSRLGRSLPDLIEIAAQLEARNIALRSLSEDIRTDTPTGRLVFHLLAALSQFEREIIRERCAAGIAAARAKGRLGGRPRKFSDTDIIAAQALLKDGALTVAEVAKTVGVSEATLFRYLPSPRAGGKVGAWAAPTGVARIPQILAPPEA